MGGVLVLGDGLRLAYDETGEPRGLPVVLLHGYADSHRFFAPLLPHLGSGLRVLALTLRGHGDSEKPDDGYDLPTLAADVVHALDALEVDRAVLVGHSSGGLVAQQAACTHPNRVAGQVLVGAPQDLHGVQPPFADAVDAMTDPVDLALVREVLHALPMTHQAVSPEYVEAMVAESAKIPARVWQRALAELLTATPPTRGPVPPVATLVVHGRHDTVLALEGQEQLARAWSSDLVVIEDAGHLIAWEQPEELGRIVRGFTLRAGGRSAARAGP